MGKAWDPLGVPHVPLAHGGTRSRWAPTLIPSSFHMGGLGEQQKGALRGCWTAPCLIYPLPTASPTLPLPLHKGPMTVNQGAKRLPRINN